jgi:hypothetical protein
LLSTPVGELRALQRTRTAGQERDRTRRRRLPAIFVLGLVACLSGYESAFSAQRFQADEWITECGGGPNGSNGDCSITIPFWQTGDHGKGSFALVVMLQSGNIGIVGSPAPVRAVLRVDKYPAAECRGSRYCIFPAAQSLAVVRQLGAGSLILVDVFTAKEQFHFSLSPKGYQAGIAQIRAWGYQLSAN